MVVTEIAGVGGDLVHMGAQEQPRLLELQNDDLRAGEYHDVRPAPSLSWQLVFEDDRPLLGARNGSDDLSERDAEDLTLAPPGSHLQTIGTHTHERGVPMREPSQQRRLVEGQKLRD